MPLPPLTEAEVGEYLGRPGTDAYRRTGGLPLLLAAGGDLRVVVAGMLARLSPADRAVVEALALLGDGAGPGVLAEVTGTEPAPALAAARRAGLLGAPTEDGTPFAHALLQDGVRAAVPPGPPYRSTSGRRARCPSDCPAGPPRTGGPPAGTGRPPAARYGRPSRPVAR